MVDQILKGIDLTVSGAALILVLMMLRKALAIFVEWLPKFHGALERQAQAVVDLAEGSKSTQATQEATLATLRALSAETDRQGGEISQVHSELGEVIRLLKQGEVKQA